MLTLIRYKADRSPSCYQNQLSVYNTFYLIATPPELQVCLQAIRVFYVLKLKKQV